MVMWSAVVLLVVLMKTCEGHYQYCGTTYYEDQSGTVVSPYYPSLYADSANCTYVLEAKNQSSFTLAFSVLDIEYDSNCTYDWVQIRCVSDDIGLPARYCGRYTPHNYSITLSPCTEVEIVFNSDDVIRGSGFSIQYEVRKAGGNDSMTTMPVPPTMPGCSKYCFLSWDNEYCLCPVTIDCGKTFYNQSLMYGSYGAPGNSSDNGTTPSYGMVTSPNYPSSYPDFSDCTFYLYADVPSVFVLTFKRLDIEYDSGCAYDWVQVTCESDEYAIPAKYCGQYTSNNFSINISSCMEVEIMFHSDGSGTGSGFKISYDIQKLDCPAYCNFSNYRCSCGENDTNSTMPMKPQKPECSKGCYQSEDAEYCLCPMLDPPPPSPSGCGTVSYTGQSGRIVSPNYPSSYPNAANCTYSLRASSLSNITLTFQFLEIEYSSTCDSDWIQISCKSQASGVPRPPARYCGRTTPNSYSITLSPCMEVEIVFHSDGSVERMGFSISYAVRNIDNSVPVPTSPQGCSSGCFLSSNSNYCACPMVIPLPSYATACGITYFNDSSGMILSPNYNSSSAGNSTYPNLSNCTYKIVAYEPSNITLTFEHLDVEYELNCTFDWIQITCLSNNVGPPARYCGQRTPNNSISLWPCSKVAVVFYADASGTGTGFAISYQVDEIQCPANCTNSNGSACSCGDNKNSTVQDPLAGTRCATDCTYFVSTIFPPYCACSAKDVSDMMPSNSTMTTPLSRPTVVGGRTTISGRRTTKTTRSSVNMVATKPYRTGTTPPIKQ